MTNADGETGREWQLCECGQKPYELNPHEREVAALEGEREALPSKPAPQPRRERQHERGRSKEDRS